MKFKGTFLSDKGDLSLGPFFMTDVKKLVGLMERDDFRWARSDGMGDMKEHFIRRVRSRQSVFVAVRNFKRVVGYAAFDPIFEGTSILHIWRRDDNVPKELLLPIGRLLLDFGFNELKLRKICGTVVTEHESLLDLSERLGFALEGCLRKQRLINGIPHDVMLIGILREEVS
jgi:RimJ/RimL family protein N-acetyltransferase